MMPLLALIVTMALAPGAANAQTPGNCTYETGTATCTNNACFDFDNNFLGKLGNATDRIERGLPVVQQIGERARRRRIGLRGQRQRSAQADQQQDDGEDSQRTPGALRAGIRTEHEGTLGNDGLSDKGTYASTSTCRTRMTTAPPPQPGPLHPPGLAARTIR